MPYYKYYLVLLFLASGSQWVLHKLSGIVVDNLVPIFWLYNFDSIEFEAKEVYLK